MSPTQFASMDLDRQTTLASWVRVRGVGLHTGHAVEVALGPACAGEGVVFERRDLPGRPRIPVSCDTIAESPRSTSLERDGVRIGTVEHLLAAIRGLSLDNVRVVLDGPEVPILDGSAEPFVMLLAQAGLRRLPAGKRLLRLTRPIEVREGDRFVRLLPARQPEIECVLEFEHPLIGVERHRHRIEPAWFATEIAPARTFGFLRELPAIRQAGLARGGSLENALILDAFSVLNPEGLRYPDEFVRHKVLDLLGDLALLGAPLVARIQAFKSGHTLHRAAVRRLMAEPGCLEEIIRHPTTDSLEVEELEPLPDRASLRA
ncbi:MAG: UDP-3-O-[3-hydroxymyristoyl] N-acetylglucosamine deacetylase [Myxococcales bacterium]|nr:UDP-3-O-[3-hydroxymyristoyl] N-acetylglucosamine deacetylase [Myxococcales bacterium]